MNKMKHYLHRHQRLVFGCCMALVLVVIAVLAPVISPFDPYDLSDEMMAGPGSMHPFGTDNLGRDILSMILYGSRTSLIIGISSALIAAVIGTVIGAIAGYFGGKVDMILGEIINIFMMIPSFFLILIIVALFGSGLFKVMIVIGLTSWTGNAKIMRAQALSLRSRTFVKASEAVGEHRMKILIKHIIPNGIFPIVSNTTMGIASAILMESSLAFLGLGDPNTISWGQLIANGKAYLTSGWWISFFGGLAIIYTVVAFFFIGDGLNVILNPKIRNVTNV